MSEKTLCECGCGGQTWRATRNDAARNWIKGQPVRFCRGHGRWAGIPDYVIDPNTGCWIWQKCRNSKGYGITSRGGRTVFAHRAYYVERVGPVPQDLQLDHRCDTPSCVNPAHLVAVTPWENRKRGTSPPATNARRTHCKHGHPFTPNNMYMRNDGARECLTCKTHRHKVPIALLSSVKVKLTDLAGFAATGEEWSE